MVIAFVVMAPHLFGGALQWWENAHFFIGLGLRATIPFFAGLVDDLKGVRPFAKLTAQLVAALAVYALGVRIELVPWGSAPLFAGIFALSLTVF